MINWDMGISGKLGFWRESIKSVSGGSAMAPRAQAGKDISGHNLYLFILSWERGVDEMDFLGLQAISRASHE